MPEIPSYPSDKNVVKVIGKALKKYDKTPAGKIAKQERDYFGDSQPTPNKDRGMKREKTMSEDIETRYMGKPKRGQMAYGGE